MTNYDLKQIEWERHAFNEHDLGKQVLRPTDYKTWGLLSEDIIKKLQLEQNVKSILDVGCGNGHLTSLFKDKSEEIFGIDYAPSMIEQAKKIIPDGNFFVGSAELLPFSPSFFSRTICYSIFHYFSDEEQIYKVVDEICRVTSPGGIILIGDLLDKHCEEYVKNSSDLGVEANLPSIKRYSEWLFVDLEKIAKYLEKKGNKTEILEQPAFLPTSSYRKDLKIWK